MKINTIKKRLKKNGWYISRIINGPLFARNGFRVVSGDTMHEIFRLVYNKTN